MRLKDYAKMSYEQRQKALLELMSETDTATARIEAEITELELQYGMTSDIMRAKVGRGELDTEYTSRWLVLLDALGR